MFPSSRHKYENLVEWNEKNWQETFALRPQKTTLSEILLKQNKSILLSQSTYPEILMCSRHHRKKGFSSHVDLKPHVDIWIFLFTIISANTFNKFHCWCSETHWGIDWEMLRTVKCSLCDSNVLTYIWQIN